MTLVNEPINRGEIRKKYCRFKKHGIKYIDYKDPNFLLKFVNEQGKSFQEDFQVTLQSISAKWLKRLRKQDIWLCCHS